MLYTVGKTGDTLAAEWAPSSGGPKAGAPPAQPKGDTEYREEFDLRDAEAQRPVVLVTMMLEANLYPR